MFGLNPDMSLNNTSSCSFSCGNAVCFTLHTLTHHCVCVGGGMKSGVRCCPHPLEAIHAREGG